MGSSWHTSPDIVWVEDANSVRLFDARSGEFKTMNGSAAAIWLLISDGQDFEGIVDTLGRRFRAETESDWNILRSDARDFIKLLLDDRLIAIA